MSVMSGRSSSSNHGRSLYVYEDEPYWSMCLREYVIPAVVFALLVYYLAFHVLLPLRHMNRPTRQTGEELTAAPAVTNVVEGDVAPKATALWVKEKKDQ